MGNIAYRILALLVGAALVVTGLVSSAGAAIIVPIAMWVAASVVRRRGRRVTPAGSWLAGVLSYSAIITVAAIWAATLGPMRGQAATIVKNFETAQKQPPPPLPAFLRDLPGAKPAPLSPMTVKIIGVVTPVMTVEFLGLLTGSICWAGVTLVMYGVTGPRSRLPATTPPST
jgi:hypothetical protein